MTDAALWAGRVGRTWAEEAEAFDLVLGDAGLKGLAALAPRPGERILDLGCGAGATTAALAEAVGPGGAAVGIDISAEQVAVARRRASGATFIVGDAASHPFGTDAFDALYSRFGSMFFDEPRAAFTHLHTALKPGARAVMLAWADRRANPFFTLPAEVGAAVLGPAPPADPTAPGPFAWADPSHVRPILADAGFSGIRFDPHRVEVPAAVPGARDPVASAVRFFRRIGPLAARLAEAGDAAAAEAETLLAERLAPLVRDGAVRFPGEVWVVHATA